MRRLVRERARAKEGKAEDSKVLATTAASTDIHRVIVPSRGLVMEETEAVERVKEKEDSKDSAGHAGSMDTPGIVARKGRGTKGRVRAKAKEAGEAREKALVSQTTGRECKLVWVDQWKRWTREEVQE